MYVVTVTFIVKDLHVAEFTQAVLLQAQNSLVNEEHCHQFDVCTDPSSHNRIFLYEVYSQKADFDDHLKTDHFCHFDKQVNNWLISKQVETWNLKKL